MTRRMLDSGIWANEHFAGLPPMVRLLQIGIINLADDQGRMKAHPAYLRSQIFPYDDVTLTDVAEWLTLIVANGTILVYTVDGKDYLQLVNWWDYQSPTFASPSEYPRPDGWEDHIRFTGKNRIIYTCNWITSTGETIDSTCDQDGKPLGRPSQSHDQPCGASPGQSHGQSGDTPGAPLIEDKKKNKNKNKKEEEEEDLLLPPVTLPEAEPELAAATRCYEANIGDITQRMGEVLADACDTYPAGWIADAIGEAVKYNKRSWAYTEKVLKRWERDGRAPQPPPGEDSTTNGGSLVVEIAEGDAPW